MHVTKRNARLIAFPNDGCGPVIEQKNCVQRASRPMKTLNGCQRVSTWSFVGEVNSFPQIDGDAKAD
jgi:hypothetical protein